MKKSYFSTFALKKLAIIIYGLSSMYLILKSFFDYRPAFFFCNNDDPESSDAAPMPQIKSTTASISAPSRRATLVM
jgi:hypothetical protein